MKLLVATRKTQGQRENDFCWADDGEVLKFTIECGGEPIDGPCGCRRAMSGVKTAITPATYPRSATSSSQPSDDSYVV